MIPSELTFHELWGIGEGLFLSVYVQLFYHLQINDF